MLQLPELTRAMELLFWISAGVVVYAYAGYPVVLFLLASAWQMLQDLRYGLGRRERRRAAAGYTPSVTLIFSAHNEEAVIQDKIRNCLALDYPPEKLDVLVGCDGCDDRTAALVLGMYAPNVQVFEFPRSGKPLTLNRLVPLASGEIAVLSDANTQFAPDALRAMVRHFANPEVGCVSGELRLTAPEGGSQSEGLYWRFETFLKFLESRMNMMVGANGGIFAIRTALFTELPPGTIIDDFLISMRIRARGLRVVYDPEAIGREEAATLSQEFRRRIRIGAGNLHALFHTWKMLSPTAGLVAFSYWSHKILRWLVPLALPAALVAAILLAYRPVYAVFAALAIWFYVMAALGYALERGKVRIRVLSVPYHFFSLNLALLIGFLTFAFGRQNGAWKPTGRSSSAHTGKKS